MKKVFLNMLVVASVMIAASACDPKKADDSKEVAEEQNEKKADDTQLTKDADFAVDVADAGLFDIQASNLALSKASSSEVKKFAQMVVDSHTAVQNELKSVAAAKNITLPDVMSEECQKKFYDLDQKNKGEDFDKEYVDLMVKEHKDIVEKFEEESDKGNDPELKSWAGEKLATLRAHLERAKTIEDALEK
jgi:putative membrane protein